MRIDDENKVVWCSEGLLDWHSRKVSRVTSYYAVADAVGTYTGSKEFKCIFSGSKEFETYLVAILRGYAFKLEQPKKYYWRKKNEYQTKYEQDHSYGYLVKGISVPYIISGYGSTFTYTEQEARDLLKDDFDKFEKVECE